MIRTIDSRSGDLRLVGGIVRGRIGGIEPLRKELVKLGMAGRTLVRQPLMEDILELRLCDTATAKISLDLLHRSDPTVRRWSGGRGIQDLAQGKVGCTGTGVGA